VIMVLTSLEKTGLSVGTDPFSVCGMKSA